MRGRGNGKGESSAPSRPTIHLSRFSFLAVAALGACTSITTRPSFRPLPLAALDTLTADPAAVITEGAAQLRKLGLVVRAMDAREGFLETRWFDPRNHRSHRENTDPVHRVRVRIWADLVTPRQIQLAVETAYRRTIDPSVPEREDELVAPPGSPGDSLTQAVRAALQQRFAIDTTAGSREKGKGKGEKQNPK